MKKEVNMGSNKTTKFNVMASFTDKARLKKLNNKAQKLENSGWVIIEKFNGGLMRSSYVLATKSELQIPEDIKLDDKNQSDSLNEWNDDLTIIWAGDTKEIEFTYENYSGKKSRRKVQPTELSYDNKKELTIKGICAKSNEKRHFKAHNITTMIKVGNQRFDAHDWAEKYLNVDLLNVDELVW